MAERRCHARTERAYGDAKVATEGNWLMQEIPDPRRTRRGLVLAAMAIGLLLVASLGAAIYDWYWWEPYNALLPYLAVIVLGLAALVLATRRRTRPVAMLVAAIGAGVLLGGALGPARPQLQSGQGTMEVSLTAPGTVTASGQVTCGVDDRATELQLSGDARVNVFPDNPAAPTDVDQREFLGIGVWVGDRWRRAVRDDGVALLVLIGRVEGELSETRLVAGPDSTVDLEWSAEGGRVTFAGLVPDADGGPPGEPIDLAGSLAWTCG
jgi:hypothetical protein